jgi:hypothetical protein
MSIWWRHHATLVLIHEPQLRRVDFPRGLLTFICTLLPLLRQGPSHKYINIVNQLTVLTVARYLTSCHLSVNLHGPLCGVWKLVGEWPSPNMPIFRVSCLLMAFRNISCLHIIFEHFLPRSSQSVTGFSHLFGLGQHNRHCISTTLTIRLSLSIKLIMDFRNGKQLLTVLLSGVFHHRLWRSCLLDISPESVLTFIRALFS